mmetsp:Transcript_17689/g.42518  ORF Transcript_17689/g.42518 Transcript_17689/m.42518 type:complete len:114 (+) Transcript_17689:1428-1769(+)
MVGLMKGAMATEVMIAVEAMVTKVHMAMRRATGIVMATATKVVMAIRMRTVQRIRQPAMDMVMLEASTVKLRAPLLLVIRALHTMSPMLVNTRNCWQRGQSDNGSLRWALGGP